MSSVALVAAKRGSTGNDRAEHRVHTTDDIAGGERRGRSVATVGELGTRGRGSSAARSAPIAADAPFTPKRAAPSSAQRVRGRRRG